LLVDFREYRMILAPLLYLAAHTAPCAAAEFRQFDFWVGDWEVSRTGSSEITARSRIERLYDGCAIRENWMPLANSGGGSLSAYDRGDRRWRQRWIDHRGTIVDFDGGLVEGQMILTGLWRDFNGTGGDALVRMSYSRGADGSVRQFGEQSADQGRTWTAAFDLTYRPASKPPQP
jgi:hypothetical protein